MSACPLKTTPVICMPQNRKTLKAKALRVYF